MPAPAAPPRRGGLRQQPGRSPRGPRLRHRAPVASSSTTFSVSPPIETDPEGEGLEDQPPYLNAAAVGESDSRPRATSRALLEIEQAFGRARPYPGAPRTLDLDLILAGDDVVEEAELRVPHPRFRERFFVLGPLAEVGCRICGIRSSGLTMGELLRGLLRR